MRHAQLAKDYFLEGYNCAQAVFAAFCDVTNMEKEEALRLSSSFGGGMGRMREVCGAVSGIFMVAGILWGYDSPQDDEAKKQHYALIQELAESFKAKHKTLLCRELLENLKTDSSPTPDKRTEEYYHTRPCIRFVMDAADILDDMIERKSSEE